MANTGSYSMCMRGTDEAVEELRALLDSDEFPGIYGCDSFGFDEPNRFSGGFNGSFLNSADIRNEEGLFRSAVDELGLEVEVYGQEIGSSYEEHFVIEGDSLTVDEQDGNAFDEPIADLTLDEIDEIAKTYGMGASRDAVIKAYDNGNIRFGGYEWNFNFAPAYARENDPVLQERFLKFLEDGVKESGTGIFTISDAADLSETGFTQAQAMEMFRFFDESDAFRSSVAIGRDPFITCYPTLPDDIKAFGHPRLDQAQELVPLNERSILDCGEDEIDEVKHAAENDTIASDIEPSHLSEVEAFAVRINSHDSEPTYDLLIDQGMNAVFDRNNVDYKTGVDWALSKNGNSVTGFTATCHGAWPGGVERVAGIEFRKLTEGAAFAVRQDVERIDELSDKARNAELGELFEDASKLQPCDSLARYIQSDIQHAVEFAVSEYALDQTLGVDDWRIEAARSEAISDDEFNRMFGVDDDDRMGLSAFTGELKDAAEHKHGDDSISRNEPEHDGR